jgi:hypothetical protein
VEVKLFDGEAPGERFILCRSADRRSKKRAMHEKFSQRIETALERLRAGSRARRSRWTRPRSIGPATQLTRGRSV